MDTAVQAALDAKYSTCQTLHGGHSCRATVKMPAESTKEQKIAQFQGKYYDNMKVVDTHHRSFHFIQRACTITMFSGRASFWGNAYTVHRTQVDEKFACKNSERRTDEKK